MSIWPFHKHPSYTFSSTPALQTPLESLNTCPSNTLSTPLHLNGYPSNTPSTLYISTTILQTPLEHLYTSTSALQTPFHTSYTSTQASFTPLTLQHELQIILAAAVQWLAALSTNLKIWNRNSAWAVTTQQTQLFTFHFMIADK